jgi:pyruvate/oxaloacetate carboxyltransferase
MTKDEALKMAIEVLDLNVDCVSESKWNEAINACKEALERQSNMVAVPADKLEKMQKELKRLRKKVQEVKDKETNRSWGVFS